MSTDIFIKTLRLEGHDPEGDPLRISVVVEEVRILGLERWACLLTRPGENGWGETSVLRLSYYRDDVVAYAVRLWDRIAADSENGKKLPECFASGLLLDQRFPGDGS